MPITPRKEKETILIFDRPRLSHKAREELYPLLREVIPQGFKTHSWNLDSTLSGAPKPDVVQVLDFGFQKSWIPDFSILVDGINKGRG